VLVIDKVQEMSSSLLLLLLLFLIMKLTGLEKKQTKENGSSCHE